MDMAALKNAIQADCVGKEVCVVKNLSSFVDSTNAAFNAAECTGIKSLMYL